MIPTNSKDLVLVWHSNHTQQLNYAQTSFLTLPDTTDHGRDQSRWSCPLTPPRGWAAPVARCSAGTGIRTLPTSCRIQRTPAWWRCRAVWRHAALSWRRDIWRGWAGRRPHWCPVCSWCLLVICARGTGRVVCPPGKSDCFKIDETVVVPICLYLLDPNRASPEGVYRNGLSSTKMSHYFGHAIVVTLLWSRYCHAIVRI